MEEIKMESNAKKYAVIDIKDLENEIKKNTDKKAEAEKSLQEANDNVKAVETEVKKYEALSK